jgi:hypothetical protein
MEVTGKYAVKTVTEHVQKWNCGAKGEGNLSQKASQQTKYTTPMYDNEWRISKFLSTSVVTMETETSSIYWA